MLLEEDEEEVAPPPGAPSAEDVVAHLKSREKSL